MNPHAVSARNYRRFRELDLELPSGTVAVIGANGAGKSSLVNVVDLVLFGSHFRSWAPYLTRGGESQTLELGLRFEHAGELYRARRGFNASTKKATFDLERQSDDDEHRERDDGWEPLTRSRIDETERLLSEILGGLTRETFRASSMLVQGDGAAFTEADPADRKRILATILGLERFERYLAGVKTVRSEADTRKAQIDGELSRVDLDLRSKDEVERRLGVARETRDAADAELKIAEADLERKREEYRAGEALKTDRARAAAALAEAKGTLQPLEARWTAAETAKAELQGLQEELDTFATPAQVAGLEATKAELEQALEATRRAAIRRQEIEREIATAVEKRDDLNRRQAAADDEADRLQEQADALAEPDLEEAVCDACGQALEGDARAKRAASYAASAEVKRGEAAGLEKLAAEVEIPTLPAVEETPRTPAGVPLDVELASLETLLEACRLEGLSRARLEGRAQTLQEAVAAKSTVQELAVARTAVREADAALLELPPAPSDAELEQVKTAGETARARVEEERIRHAAANGDAIRAEAELERLAALETSSAEIRLERDGLLRRIETLAVLARAYGKDGIPSIIVGRVAIPAIEREATRILAELGASYRVELRTEKALATGRAADTLDVVIVTEEGEAPYETFSGGERTRINLALRIGLARLLAHRRGAESRLLAIDEPEFLDDAGTAALVGILRGLSGDFERVFLISHNPALRDAALDATIEVSRGEDGLSRAVA